MKHDGTIDEIKLLEIALAEYGVRIISNGQELDSNYQRLWSEPDTDVKAYSMVYEVDIDGKEYYARFWYDWRVGRAQLKSPTEVFNLAVKHASKAAKA